MIDPVHTMKLHEESDSRIKELHNQISNLATNLALTRNALSNLCHANIIMQNDLCTATDKLAHQKDLDFAIREAKRLLDMP